MTSFALLSLVALSAKPIRKKFKTLNIFFYKFFLAFFSSSLANALKKRLPNHDCKVTEFTAAN